MEVMKMNPFTLLKDDHKKVKGLFEEFEALGDRAHKQKRELVDKALQELEVHTQIEEEIFYPAVKESAAKEGRELIVEAYEEHGVVKRLMEEIKELEPEDEKYSAKFKVIQDSVKHHIKEEENELFPQAKKALGSQADEIGDRMEERKLELMESLGLETEEIPRKAASKKRGMSSQIHASR
jgi:hemerythrin-like domain-containing protein